MQVYVLNSAFECVSLTSAARAIHLIKEGRANPVKWSDRVINTVRGVIKIPEIIILMRYIKAFGRKMGISKQLVAERDEYICQYCGKKTSESERQIDHVHPRCKGGKDTWENLVCSCSACNSKKANKSLLEAGMTLLRKPFKPTMTRGQARIMAEVERLLASHQTGEHYVA